MNRLARYAHRLSVLVVALTLSSNWCHTLTTAADSHQQIVDYAPSSRLEDRSETTANPFRRPRFRRSPEFTDQLPGSSARIGHVVSKQHPSEEIRSREPVEGQPRSLKWQSPGVNKVTSQEAEQPAASRPRTERPPRKKLPPHTLAERRPAVDRREDTVTGRHEPKAFFPPDDALGLVPEGTAAAPKQAPLPSPDLQTTAALLDDMDQGFLDGPPQRIQDDQPRTRTRRQRTSADPMRRASSQMTRPAHHARPVLRRPDQVSYQSQQQGFRRLFAGKPRQQRPRFLPPEVPAELDEPFIEPSGYQEPCPYCDGAAACEDCIATGSAFTCDCGDTCCECCGDPEYYGDELVSIGIPYPREFTMMTGVHGFRGPLDLDRDRGNFGFHEGFNWGGKLPWYAPSTVGYQLGYQLVHSQLHGSENNSASDSHTQQFVTAGLFRRPPCGGWQFGVVWDMLRDERHRSIDLHQLRGELGFLSGTGQEIGFAFAAHTNDTSVVGVDFRASDQYLLYYRIHAAHGGEARFFGGLNNTSKGIVGADVLLPVHDRCSIQSGFAYMIPEEGGPVGAEEEAWSLGLNLVWHLGGRARRCHQSIYRPLFDVADNSSLIVDGRQ